MKIREVIYEIDEKALQRIEERLFELNVPFYAIEENDRGLFLKSYDPRVDEFMKSEGFEPTEIREVDPLEWAKNQLREPFELVEGIMVDPVGNHEGEGTVLRIPPGMAFGTGIHPTTRLAASFVVDYFEKGKSFLDVGTGSGILSILAAKLGASQVLGIDLDENAIEIAKENAELNGVNVRFVVGDLLKNINDRYDFVVANIVPEVLKKMAIDSRRVLKDTGFLVLSGINEEELENILVLYRSMGYEILEIRREEDWASTILKLS